MRWPCLTFLVAACIGCQTLATQAPPPRADEPPDPGVSPFRSDAVSLSDADIDRILRTRVDPPDSLRVAILHLDHEARGTPYGWPRRPAFRGAQQEFTVRKARSDFSFAETVERAKTAAMDAAMTRNVEQLARFLRAIRG